MFKSFFKLVRWPNLVMIMISMMLMLLFVINPLLNAAWFTIGLTVYEFALLVVATLCITIGGYLINDFFDMDADRINKPGTNLVGGKWPVATVQILYGVFTLAGVGLGTLLSWQVGKISYSLVFIFAAGLLWFYSERYQCIPFVGNVVVGVLSALSFGLVWLFYFFALTQDAYEFTYTQAAFSFVNRFVLIYMGFAFITSVLRELIKDIEDLAGDEKYGCQTFAVRFGQTSAKILAASISIIGLAATIFTQYYFYTAGFMLLLGYFILIDVFFIIIVIWVLQASKKSDFSRLSKMMKLLMLIGVLSMILIYFGG